MNASTVLALMGIICVSPVLFRKVVLGRNPRMYYDWILSATGAILVILSYFVHYV